MSRPISVRLDLLDKQILDRDGLPFGRVDDLEISIADAVPRVAALMVGAQALGERLGGVTGRWMAGVSARLRESSPGPGEIDVRLIEKLEPNVELSVRLADLPELAGLERWLAAKLVERLPGAGRASE